MTGALSRDPQGPGPAETALALRALRRDLSALVEQARAYRLDDAELRGLLEEALNPPPLCAGPADWRQGLDEDVCDAPAAPGSDYCPGHDPDLI